ncbi:hypothetical protein Ancab_028350 [Ancistrocladus abbreviatus]
MQNLQISSLFKFPLLFYLIPSKIACRLHSPQTAPHTKWHPLLKSFEAHRFGSISEAFFHFKQQIVKMVRKFRDFLSAGFLFNFSEGLHLNSKLGKVPLEAFY